MLCLSSQRLAYTPEIPSVETIFQNAYGVDQRQLIYVDVTRLTQREEGSNAASLSRRLLAR